MISLIFKTNKKEKCIYAKKQIHHEDIKAVGNSAAKKLVALGLTCLSSIFTLNIAFAGGCHSHFGKKVQPAQNNTQPATRNTSVATPPLGSDEEIAESRLYVVPVGESFLVADRNVQEPSNPRGLLVVYPGDYIHTSDGELIEVIDYFVNHTETVLIAGQIEYNRLNTETRNQNAGSSFMYMMLRDFSFTLQQKEEFTAAFSPFSKK